VLDRRPPLTRARVLEAAIDLADRDGVDAVSMRRLGQALGVEAMSLYTHVHGKEDLLDGMVDAVVGRFPVARREPAWTATMRATLLAARAEMARHPWAAGVLRTRPSPGPATAAYLDGVSRILADAGLSAGLADHARHALGGRVLGLTDDLFGAASGEDDVAFALDLVLDGLERERSRGAAPAPGRTREGDWRMW
jgi:AcrR family transcriptional regulator